MPILEDVIPYNKLWHVKCQDASLSFSIIIYIYQLYMSYTVYRWTQYPHWRCTILSVHQIAYALKLGTDKFFHPEQNKYNEYGTFHSMIKSLWQSSKNSINYKAQGFPSFEDSTHQSREVQWIGPKLTGIYWFSRFMAKSHLLLSRNVRQFPS